MSFEELRDIAEQLERRDRGFHVASPPAGFRLAADAPGFASEGTNPRTIVYQGFDGRGFQVEIVDGAEKSPGFNLQLTDARRVTVRGFDAIAAQMLVSAGGVALDSQTLWLSAADQFLQWIEPGNVRVTMRGVSLSASEMLTIANSLEAVDQEQWDQFKVQAPGRIGAAPVPPGPPPTFTGEVAEIVEAFQAAFAAETVDDVATNIEGGEALRDTIAGALQKTPAPLSSYSAEVAAIKLVDDRSALVTFTILSDGRPFLAHQQGAAVRIDDRWLVRRATYCAIVEVGPVKCPADGRLSENIALGMCRVGGSARRLIEKPGHGTFRRSCASCECVLRGSGAIRCWSPGIEPRRGL